MRKLILIPTVFLALAALGLAAPDEQEIVCRVAYITPDGFYVDAGTQRGLRERLVGAVRHDGTEIAKAEVVAASANSARLTIVSRTGSTDPVSGDTVHFLVPAGAARPPEEGAGEKPPAGQEEFVPLLERQKQRAGVTERKNISHGWASLSGIWQNDNESNQNYWTSILSSGGGVERLGGAPWSMRWSADASVRGGDAYSGTTLDGALLDVHELSFLRRLESGFVRLGRFLPSQLAAAGHFDGGQYERPFGGVRVGAVAGLKPRRDDLSPSLDEPAAALYATFEAGERRKQHWSGTFGILGSLWEGDFDRFAILGDQQAEIGEDVSLHLSFEVDLDVGASVVRNGTQLTRLDFFANVRAGQSTTLRAGVDEYERLDNRAERDLAGSADPLLFPDATWRAWAGVSQALPASLRLDGEVGYVTGGGEDSAVTWRVSLTRRGLFSLKSASATLSVYNLAGSGGDGIAGYLSASLPLGEGRWWIYPSVGYQTFDPDSGTGDQSLTDLRLQVDYNYSDRWSFNGSISQTFGDQVSATQLLLGAHYRW